jgi:SAM-dependent methyltransferase
MNTKDKSRIIERYNKRLSKLGPVFEALASGTEERRKMRFSILKEIGVSNGDSVLDLGCGFGDLYQYFKDEGIEVKYTGIDINPELIENAKIKFPNAEFRVLDIQQEDPGKFDYVLSTSCFNLKLQGEENYEFVTKLLTSAFQSAKKGVAVDFMTSYVDFKGNAEEAFYYSPEEIFRISKGITKRVSLRHDYPLYEFCMYLFPDFQGWQKK